MGALLYDILRGALNGQKSIRPRDETGVEGDLPLDEVDAVSTEDVLHALEDAEEVVEEKSEKVVVGSADVRALYPSLDIDLTAKVCGDLVARSRTQVEGFRPDLAAIYP